MLKFQKLVIATAVSLVAFSAMANNFRAADQVYVPDAGHVAGGSGTFISDVFVSNLSNDSVTVSVIFSGTISGQTATQSFNDKFTLAPNERKEFNDFVLANLGLNSAIGQMVFNACKQGANCANDQDPVTGISPNFRPISVESRIFAIAPGTTVGSTTTVGQLFSGIPWYMFASQEAPAGFNKIQITGIRLTGNGVGTFRTNIGLVNASQFSTTTLKASLYQGNNPSTPLATAQVTLGPLGFQQQLLSALFPTITAGPTQTNLFIIVEQVSSTPTGDAPTGCLPNGCPAFLAFGSALDNASSDPTTLEGTFTGQLTDVQIGCIFNPASYTCTQKAGGTPLRRAVKPRG
jgi:hypothetical protein